MSMDFGEGKYTAAETARGRDFPGLRQFCVFLENRVGHLNELLRCLEKDTLRVIGLSVIDSIDSATVRIIVSEVDRGRERLELGNFMFTETDVVGIELPEGDSPLRSICSALMQAELNIHYAYPLLYRRQGRNGLAVHVDDIDLALEVLSKNNFPIITEDQLREDDEFFG